MEDDIDPFGPDPVSASEEDEEEEYGLIPDELGSELERKARRTDREIAGESEETIKLMEETELMDDLMEQGKQTPLKEFLAELNLPSPATVVTEEEAEKLLKGLLRSWRSAASRSIPASIARCGKPIGC